MGIESSNRRMPVVMKSRSIRTSSRTCPASRVRPARLQHRSGVVPSVANAPTLRSGRVWSNARPERRCIHADVAGEEVTPQMPIARDERVVEVASGRRRARSKDRGRDADVPAPCVATRLRRRRRARPRRRRRSSPRRRALPRRLPRRRPRTPALGCLHQNRSFRCLLDRVFVQRLGGDRLFDRVFTGLFGGPFHLGRSCPTPLVGQRMVRAGHPGAVRVNPQPGARCVRPGRLPRLGPHGPSRRPSPTSRCAVRGPPRSSCTDRVGAPWSTSSPT